MENKKNIRREIDLSELPRWVNDGTGKAKEGTINWMKTIGYKIKFIYDDIEGHFEILDYEPIKQKLKIKYGNNQRLIQTSDIIKCNIINVLNNKTSEFKIEIGTIFKDDKRDITILDREMRKKTYIRKDGRENNCNQKWYKYTCKVCNWTEGWMTEEHLSNRNCSCCSGNTTVEGINDIPTTAPWMIPYFQGGYDEAKLYSKQSNKEIIPICPNCGRISKKHIAISSIYNDRSIRCKCSDKTSIISKYIFNLLEQLQLIFETEITYDWCKFYSSYKQKDTCGRYDFVIENMKLIIEADGGFHRCDNTLNGQTNEESKFIDDEKDRLANENGYKVIRISDECDIKQNILDSDLNKLFDLSKINWFKCEEFTCKSFIKMVCDYKNIYPELFTMP